MEEVMNRSESSIEITRNSKGIYQFAVKVYCDVNLDFGTKEAIRITKQLEKEFPHKE